MRSFVVGFVVGAAVVDAEDVLCHQSAWGALCNQFTTYPPGTPCDTARGYKPGSCEDAGWPYCCCYLSYGSPYQDFEKTKCEDTYSPCKYQQGGLPTCPPPNRSGKVTDTPSQSGNAAASNAELKLAWSDCGDSSTHTKITGFSPSTITTGQKSTMTGTGNLDEDVSGASFDLEMKTAAGTISCKGDASQSKTCHLPLGVGSLTFDAMAFPIKKGSTSVSVDLSLSALLPGALAHTETKVTATAADGDQLFCMDIKSAPAARSNVIV